MVMQSLIQSSERKRQGPLILLWLMVDAVVADAVVADVNSLPLASLVLVRE